MLDERRVLVRFLDAQRRYRAPAQAFEAQRTGAGEQLQHPRADDTCAEAVEDRLFDEVGRRTNFRPLGVFKIRRAALPPVMRMKIQPRMNTN